MGVSSFDRGENEGKNVRTRDNWVLGGTDIALLSLWDCCRRKGNKRAMAEALL